MLENERTFKCESDSPFTLSKLNKVAKIGVLGKKNLVRDMTTWSIKRERNKPTRLASIHTIVLHP